jgi:hypothetical protein
VVDGNGVKACLYIGQILQEQLCHIGVDMLSVRHWRVSMGAASRPWFFSLARGMELVKHKTVAEVPGHTWKLPCTIGRSRHSLSKLRRHVSISLECHSS